MLEVCQIMTLGLPSIMVKDHTARLISSGSAARIQNMQHTMFTKAVYCRFVSKIRTPSPASIQQREPGSWGVRFNAEQAK
jgi:hypothetical protein